MNIFKSFVLLLAIAVSNIFAAVHPGLKKAVDDGDLDKAQKIIENAGVRDLYLPSTLNVEDAEKIYRSFLAKDSLTFLNCILLELDQRSNHYGQNVSCSHAFNKAYQEKICTGNSSRDIGLCGIWMNHTYFDDWRQYEKGICQGPQSVKNCSRFLDSLSTKERFEHIRPLLSKGMLIIDSVYYVDTSYTEPILLKDCKKTADEYEKRSFKEISAIGDGLWNGFKASCRLDGSIKKKKECIRVMRNSASEMNRLCKDGNLVNRISEKLRKVKRETPFEYDIKGYKRYLDHFKWYEVDSSWVSNRRLTNSLISYMDSSYNWIKSEISFLKSAYSDSGDFDISELVRACTLFPDIDKAIEKDFQFEVFSCSQILKTYFPTCDNEKDLFRYFSATLNGTDSVQLACGADNRWHASDSLGWCLAANLGEKSDGGLVCDTVWKDSIKADLAGTLCVNDTSVQGKYNVDRTYLCEKGIWYFVQDGASKMVNPKDGRIYNLVQVRNQTWMRENLGFYGYYRAMDACPAGWRLPTADDFETLLQNDEGDVLSDGKYWLEDNGVMGKCDREDCSWGGYTHEVRCLKDDSTP